MATTIEHHHNTQQLLRLMTLLSPVFPVGSFSYSHGLEQAVHDGLINNCAEAGHWLRNLLHKGTAHNDVIFLAQAWQLVNDDEDISELAQLACALSGSREREMETLLQGKAFLKAVMDYDFIFDGIGENLPYPVAVGAVSARMGLERTSAVTAYLHAFVSNLVQAALRLVPLGQKDGVKLLHVLEEDILALGEQASRLTCADLGAAALMSDICAMRHETLYSRIFRS
ncbi:MAG: Urease accessory protein UreF (precursor) [Candidatus Tokpelaia hoelldobleri]|uniref:Urease accessory protein UreF n=1 Tax=Candidatus Tokpelaia hoelldobleri TaxID=1902579 RepID=A0A1U9JTM4_9HYPH|nr:MAG: Urease accessory protein UreF (precursor) [Candidatus Tokpelaia hoelldoblerii]